MKLHVSSTPPMSFPTSEIVITKPQQKSTVDYRSSKSKQTQNAVLAEMSSYSQTEATNGLVIPTREPLVASELKSEATGAILCYFSKISCQLRFDPLTVTTLGEHAQM